MESVVGGTPVYVHWSGLPVLHPHLHRFTIIYTLHVYTQITGESETSPTLRDLHGKNNKCIIFLALSVACEE